MYRLSLNHVPGQPDQDFDCSTLSEAIAEARQATRAGGTYWITDLDSGVVVAAG